MMKPIKIAFFDIDGTIVAPGTNKISNRVADALNQLKENGILICIATGRPMMNIPKFENVAFDAYLSFNASYCYNKDGVIYKNPIAKEEVHKIIENAKKIGRPVSLASASRMGANGSDQDLIDYYAMAKHVVEVVDEADFEKLKNEDIYQIMLGCRKEEYASILKEVSGAKITAWWPRAIDVIPADGGKGVGIGKILEYYHLTKEEAIAFGDGGNDIEMLQAVGLGVAMGNAEDDVKKIAADVCESVAEDGVYWYCRKMGLI